MLANAMRHIDFDQSLLEVPGADKDVDHSIRVA
jgi:hypothetical protein